jgi:ubiquinone/menaquinone biosynthesis C-methylase UbiE
MLLKKAITMKQIYKYIARQFGNPTGFGGKISTLIMNCLNRKLYKVVLENLNIQTTDKILDIGFGNGYLVHRLSKRNPRKMFGIDISPDMLKVATKKSRKKVEQGKVELLLADVQNLPFESASIDKIYTINTTYFWQDIHKGLAEIKRVLKPDGVFLNVIYLKEWLDKLPMTQYGFSKYTAEQIEKITIENGLKIERIFEIQSRKSICVIARK